MKLELKDNKVFFENKGHKKEIHPFWLRERVNGENFVDKSTQQRLFDTTQLSENIQIKDLSLNSNFLEIKFNDGASTKIAIVDIFKEFSNINDVQQIKNTDIAEELALPPVKIHCSVLAEDAIKAALADYKGKQEAMGKWQPNTE